MKMKRSLFLSLSLLFSIGVQAQSSPSMDGANQAIINSCKSEGGTFISFKDDKCEYSGCAYVGKNGDVSYDGDNQRVTGGCNLGEYQRKAKAAYKSEIDKKIKELEEQKKQADRIGKKPGEGSVDVGDLNGDGVVDEKDRAIAEERIRNGGGTPSGAGAGGTPAGAGAGAGAGGTPAGAGVGGNPAGADGGADTIRCDFLINKQLNKNHACFKACRKNFWGTEGTDRKKCRECVENWSVENGGDLIVDWSTIPGGKPNKFSLTLKGVGVKTSILVCRDKDGNIVSSTNVGVGGAVNCATPGVSTRTSSTSGPTGNVTVSNPSVSANVQGTVELPSFCRSTKSKDITACKNWMIVNGKRDMCSSGSDSRACMGHDYTMSVDSRYDADCVNCANRRGGRDNSWIGDAAAGLFIGAGNALSSYFTGRAYQKGQEAWAGAAVKTAEQCTINNQNYLQYTIDQQLSAVTPEQQAAMGCNGYNIGGFAGMGGAGGMGAWMGAGYSPGFMGGMYGPYGGYNPYGGGMVGGAVAGISGGYISGMQGGYINGMAGGMVGGAIAGGYMQGGYINGMAGGYMQGGYVNGMAGGYMQGGYVNGMAGGYMQGGYVNGMAGGYIQGGIGGYAQGGYAQGGYMGGYAQGGYAQGGYMGGYAQGGMAGGLIGGIQLAGGYSSGYNSGYTGGGMYGPGGGYYNPYGSGLNQGMQGNYWAASQQGSNYDRMLQQQGVSYQMGMAGGGGSAMFNPMNAGFNANFGFNTYGI